MPGGPLGLTPLPAPALSRASVKGGGAKVAVTAGAAFMVTAQVPVPVQPPPLQPVNVEPAAGVAVRVTTVPLVKPVAQVAPQEIPAGALVMLPLPAPDVATVSVNEDCTNVAVTEAAALMVTVQAPVPVQPPPLQPVNVEPAAGVAVRGAAAARANAADHGAPRDIPAGAAGRRPPTRPAPASGPG